MARVVHTYFGVVNSSGHGPSDPSEIHYKMHPMDDDLPDDEVHDGIQGMRINLDGDCTDQAFLQVWGPAKGMVKLRWLRVANILRSQLREFWV
jgi:hypothetical protein